MKECTILRSAIVLFLVLLTLSGSTQEANTLEITSPSTIAGKYRATQPTFDWCPKVESFSGTMKVAKDSYGNPLDLCQAPSIEIEGKIAIIELGDCDVLEQAFNVQSKGAIAAIICNKRSESGIPNLPTDSTNYDIDIPVFALSYDDCIKIRTAIASDDIDVSLYYSCEDLTHDVNVIWGNEPGQGDFSNGLGEWTVVNGTDSDTSWYWTEDRVIRGLYSYESIHQAAEASNCNGYMVFPSGYYDNVEVSPWLMEQPIPLCYNNGLHGIFCKGSLYSPIIDLTDKDIDGLYCHFFHDWRYYYGGSTSLIVSFDGGQTWPDTTYVSLAERATLYNPEVHEKDNCLLKEARVNDNDEGFYKIPIKNYQGQPSIQLQFRHMGGYYFATIDDVTLINEGSSDVEVLRSFVSRSPAAAMPLSQANRIPLHVDVFNAGNLDATDVSVTAEATDPSGNIEWSATNSDFLDQPAYCFLDQKVSFQDGFTPTQLGNYKVTYRNTTPDDGVAANDTISFGFETTERTWRSVNRPAMNNDGTYDQMWSGIVNDNPNGEVRCDYQWAMAYTFHLPNGGGHFLNTVRFGINYLATNTGHIKVYLFEWDPSPESLLPVPDNISQYNILADDRTLVGCMGRNTFHEQHNGQPMHNILGEQTDITVMMAIADPATGQPKVSSNGTLQPIPLKNDQMYALVFTIVADENAELEFIAADARGDESADLSTTNFALANTGQKQRYGGSVVCPLTDRGDYATEVSTLDFYNYFPPNQPWIEMDIHSESLLTAVHAEEASTKLSVYPNPVTDQLVIDLQLGRVSDRVSFELINVNGELKSRMQQNKVKQGKYTMAVGDLPSGVYTLNVRSEAGFLSEKVVITK